MNTIFFRGLGFEFNINPIAFEFLNIRIHWYGIIISLAFLVGLLVLMYYANKNKYNQDMLLDLVLITAPIAIIGARLYYVIFKFDDYRNDPLEIFKIWHGGLAIYGAIIASVITVAVYSKIKKIDLWQILDMAAPGFIIAQAIGRWGNFINQEAYGKETNLPWAMTINIDGILKSVHPTFLYESMCNLLIFIVLTVFYKYKKVNGEIFFLYIGLYSFVRLFIESLRSDSLYIGIFKISQIIAIVFIVFSVVMFIKRRKSTIQEIK